MEKPSQEESIALKRNGHARQLYMNASQTSFANAHMGERRAYDNGQLTTCLYLEGFV